MGDIIADKRFLPGDLGAVKQRRWSSVVAKNCNIKIYIL